MDVSATRRETSLRWVEGWLAEDQPELVRGEVFELVQEWLRTEDDSLH